MHTTYLYGDGYVRFIQSWGSDEEIIEAARMSTNKGFNGWDEDEGLLRYLYTNKHMTPFEMCGLTVEIKAPIFVFREWHRHRTQSYNEMSARYTPLPNENFMPERDDTYYRAFEAFQTKNKQQQGEAIHPPSYESIDTWLDLVHSAYEQAETAYSVGLRIGIPRELARITVPVGRFSKMRASANLRNWFHFLGLRMDGHAQQEIREYANAVASYVGAQFPRSTKLFLEELNRGEDAGS